MKMFSIYDSKSEGYSEPFFAPTTEAGRRIFTVNSLEVQSLLFKFGEDYTLFELAEWSELTGKIEPHEAKIPICNALEARTHYEASQGIPPLMPVMGGEAPTPPKSN